MNRVSTVSSCCSHRTDAYLLRLLEDDCPQLDLTTIGLGIEKAEGVVTAAFKRKGIVAGAMLAKRLFELSGASVSVYAEDGASLAAGEPILRAEGSAAALHAVYKTAQCVMEYACGIALRTREMLDAARAVSPGVQIALTRKHAPGTKPIAYAGLRAGGGIVHRFGLSDSILVFDQHRVFCEDFDRSLKRLQAESPERKVAVEAGGPESTSCSASGFRPRRSRPFAARRAGSIRGSLSTPPAESMPATQRSTQPRAPTCLSPLGPISRRPSM